MRVAPTGTGVESRDGASTSRQFTKPDGIESTGQQTRKEIAEKVGSADAKRQLDEAEAVATKHPYVGDRIVVGQAACLAIRAADYVIQHPKEIKSGAEGVGEFVKGGVEIAAGEITGDDDLPDTSAEITAEADVQTLYEEFTDPNTESGCSDDKPCTSQDRQFCKKVDGSNMCVACTTEGDACTSETFCRRYDANQNEVWDCYPKKKLDFGCTKNTECASGYCVDGKCRGCDNDKGQCNMPDKTLGWCQETSPDNTEPPWTCKKRLSHFSECSTDSMCESYKCKEMDEDTYRCADCDKEGPYPPCGKNEFCREKDEYNRIVWDCHECKPGRTKKHAAYSVGTATVGSVPEKAKDCCYGAKKTGDPFRIHWYSFKQSQKWECCNEYEKKEGLCKR